jgi:hypothetical protein
MHGHRMLPELGDRYAHRASLTGGNVVACRGRMLATFSTPTLVTSAMTSRRPELVSKATRRAFRSLATDVYVRAIAELWEDHGFLPASAIDYEDSSVRRTRFECYAAAVDWTDVSQVQQTLRVFEALLRWLARQDWHTDGSFDEVRELLDRDGFRLDEGWRIHWRRPPALEATLAGLTDPSGIRAELERIRRALPDDPAGAIGAAKMSFRYLGWVWGDPECYTSS